MEDRKDTVKISDVLREIDEQIALLEKSAKNPLLRKAHDKAIVLGDLKKRIKQNNTKENKKSLTIILSEWEAKYAAVIDTHQNILKARGSSPTSMREFVSNFVNDLRFKYVPEKPNEVRVTLDLQKKLDELLKIKNDPKLNSEIPAIKTQQAKMIADAIGHLSTDEIYIMAVKLMQDHLKNNRNLAMMRSDAEIGDSSRLIKDLYNAFVVRLGYNAYDKNKNNPVDQRLNVLHWFVNASVTKNLNKEDPVKAVSSVIFNTENERRTNRIDYADAAIAMQEARMIALERTAAMKDQSLIGNIVNDSVKSEICPVIITLAPVPKKAPVKQKVARNMLATGKLISSMRALSQRAEGLAKKLKRKKQNVSDESTLDISRPQSQSSPITAAPRSEQSIPKVNSEEMIAKYEEKIQQVHQVLDDLAGITSKEEKIRSLNAFLKGVNFHEDRDFPQEPLKTIQEIYAKHHIAVKVENGYAKPVWSSKPFEYAAQMKMLEAIPKDEEYQISQAQRALNAINGFRELEEPIKLLRDDLFRISNRPQYLVTLLVHATQENSEHLEKVLLNCDKKEVLAALSKLDIDDKKGIDEVKGLDDVKVLAKLMKIIDHPKILALISSDPRMQKIEAEKTLAKGIEVHHVGKSVTIDNSFFQHRSDDWRKREDTSVVKNNNPGKKPTNG